MRRSRNVRFVCGMETQPDFRKSMVRICDESCLTYVIIQAIKATRSPLPRSFTGCTEYRGTKNNHFGIRMECRKICGKLKKQRVLKSQCHAFSLYGCNLSSPYFATLSEICIFQYEFCTSVYFHFNIYIKKSQSKTFDLK